MVPAAANAQLTGQLAAVMRAAADAGVPLQLQCAPTVHVHNNSQVHNSQQVNNTLNQQNNNTQQNAHHTTQSYVDGRSVALLGASPAGSAHAQGPLLTHVPEGATPALQPPVADVNDTSRVSVTEAQADQPARPPLQSTSDD